MVSVWKMLSRDRKKKRLPLLQSFYALEERKFELINYSMLFSKSWRNNLTKVETLRSCFFQNYEQVLIIMSKFSYHVLFLLWLFGFIMKQETLQVVRIALIYSTLASLWKFNVFGGLYITQSNIYDEAFIAKIVSP